MLGYFPRSRGGLLHGAVIFAHPCCQAPIFSWFQLSASQLSISFKKKKRRSIEPLVL